MGNSDASSTKSSEADRSADEEIWAVEVLESLGKRGNSDLLVLAAEECLRHQSRKGKKVHVKLVNITTAVPCGLGSASPVSQVEKGAIKAHEVRVFQEAVSPLLATSAAKKVTPRYVPARNDKREAGLVELAHKMKAARFYVPVKKNSSLVEKLAVRMPGGCVVVGVSGRERVMERVAASVDVFDSSWGEEGDAMNAASSGGSVSRTASIDFYDAPEASPAIERGAALSGSSRRRALQGSPGGSFRESPSPSQASPLPRHSTFPQSPSPGHNPSLSGPSHSFSGPNPNFLGPSHSFSSPDPNFSGPSHSFSGPNPNFPGANHSFSELNPNFPGANNSFSGLNPNFPGANNSFSGLNPNFCGPNPSFSGPQPVATFSPSPLPSHAPSLSGPQGLSTFAPSPCPPGRTPSASGPQPHTAFQSQSFASVNSLNYSGPQPVWLASPMSHLSLTRGDESSCSVEYPLALLQQGGGSGGAYSCEIPLGQMQPPPGAASSFSVQIPRCTSHGSSPGTPSKAPRTKSGPSKTKGSESKTKGSEAQGTSPNVASRRPIQRNNSMDVGSAEGAKKGPSMFGMKLPLAGLPRQASKKLPAGVSSSSKG